MAAYRQKFISMPVDYKLRSLRRLFGQSNFLKPVTRKPPASSTAAGKKKSASSLNPPDVSPEEHGPASPAPSAAVSTHVAKRALSVGGLPRAIFSEAPPRSVMGKAISGHMYSVNLFEKQKMKVYYGAMRDGKFQRYVERARAKRMNTDAELMRLLEVRLDSFLYRTGFVKTPMQARQWIFHGHVRVNGRIVDQKGFEMTKGDILTVDEEFLSRAFETQWACAILRAQVNIGQSWLVTPKNSNNAAGMTPWIEIDRSGLAAALVRLPNNDELGIFRNSCLFPFIRDVNMEPHSAMRCYR